MRVSPEQIETLLHPSLDPKYADHESAKGLPASPGAVSGVIAFTAQEAVNLKENNIDCILVDKKHLLKIFQEWWRQREFLRHEEG